MNQNDFSLPSPDALYRPEPSCAQGTWRPGSSQYGHSRLTLFNPGCQAQSQYVNLLPELGQLV